MLDSEICNQIGSMNSCRNTQNCAQYLCLTAYLALKLKCALHFVTLMMCYRTIFMIGDAEMQISIEQLALVDNTHLFI